MARAFAGLVVILAAQTTLAGTFTIFGPQTYTRETATPVEQRASFGARNTAIPYTLRIENGNGGQYSLVTSAVVKINGREVVGPDSFNGSKAVRIETTVTLAALNEMTVELRGNPGSGLSLSITGEDNDRPSIRAIAAPPPNASGWNDGAVQVNFACSDATSEVVQCSESITVSGDGANQSVTGTASDAAGNTASATVQVSIDQTRPAVAFTNAPDTASIHSLTLSGTAFDSLSGVASVTCNGTPVTLTSNTFQCGVTLEDGLNVAELAVTDVAGNSNRGSAAIRLDQQPPSVQILQPAQGATVPASTFTVTGVVTDDDEVASVRIGGTPAALSNGEFSGTVTLANGPNTITVTATDRAGNDATAQVGLNRFSIPAVTITAPADQAVVGTPTVSVTGTVSDPAATVRVNGVAAVVNGSAWRADGVPLQQGRTVVTAAATDTAGHVASSTAFVYRDSIPPRVTVYSPANGSTVYQPSVDVTGMVDDIVVGTINAGQARITVNGTAAEVANRAFLARNITLAPGLNTLTIIATDQGGNSAGVTANVTYDATAQPRILEVSGDDQRGAITSTLPLPLVVRLVDAGGAPVANHAVTYEVTQNNGSLSAGQATARVLTVQTNAQGQASVSWHLGARSGAGNNRVRARASGFAGAVEFDATATSGTPSMIVVDSGSNQIGALGSILPRPLMAVVVDSGSNRIAGVPVTFSAVEGNATFGGSPTVVVTTDSDGRAWATPVLGDARDNTFAASIAGGDAAVFVATGKPAGVPSETRISGVVLDNQNQAIAGVSMRVEGTQLGVQTNDQGQFAIASAPVGYVKLIADGSTALRSGTWPTLEYAVFTIAGQDNTLEMPVYLLPIDVRRGVFVDEVTGGTVSIPELPGFALTIAPGSATFPGGSRTGTVSATLVHSDKMPMAPGFGQQPRFIVTIQPPGVHFDPPAALTLPNADGLTPGQVTEMYSFDHDLGQFVSIGTGAVSEDGTVVTSDPGVGIIKGGWHCGGDPSPTGASASCAECKKCNGTTCVTDPAKAGQPCTDDGNPATQDVCEDGTCKHKTVSVAIGGPGPSASATGGVAALAGEDFRNMWVLRDDPAKHWDDAVQLTPGQPVWGNPGLGSDYLLYRAYVTPASMRTHVTNYRWNAVGPETITGPGGPSATQWTFNTGISWDPGDYTITLEVTFDTGVTKTTTYKQRVGLRTDDMLVIGWINKAGVPVNADGVYWAVTELFPPEGLCSSGLVKKLAAAAYLGTLVLGGDARPFGPPDNFLSPADRRYLLNWQFKHGGNPGAPPPLFFNEEQVADYKESNSLWKLWNRAHVKYFVADGKINGVQRLKKDTLIGTTIDPISCLVPVPGEAGVPWNGKFIVRDTEIHQINDGTPDAMAVAGLNTLTNPLKWSHIGSKIQFTLAAGINGEVTNQVYPTYSKFRNRSLYSVDPQAPEPIMNFSLTPFPPGPPFPPYIIPD